MRRVVEDPILAAERATARDLVDEHGEVGAIRLAYRVVALVVARITPTVVREGWERFALVPLARLVALVEHADAQGRIGPRAKATRPEA